MNTDELREGLEAVLSGGRSLGDLHMILKEFAQGGGSAQEAALVLDGLRAGGVNEQQDDLILEALDYVRGFCSPLFRIWT